MSKKGKAPQVDPSQAINASREALAYQERYTPTSSIYETGPFGSTSSAFDPTTKQITTKVNVDPTISKGLLNYLGKLNNFDNDVSNELEADKATDKYVFDDVTKQLGDLYGNIGQGKNSSLGNNFVSNFSRGLAYDSAGRLTEKRQAARQRVQQRNSDYFNMFYTPYSAVAGTANPQMTNANVTGLAQGGANIYGNMGQIYSNAANTNAQLQMQQKMRPGLGQTLLGAAVGLGSQALGAYMGKGG